jgi:hypothetical protein
MDPDDLREVISRYQASPRLLRTDLRIPVAAADINAG